MPVPVDPWPDFINGTSPADGDQVDQRFKALYDALDPAQQGIDNSMIRPDAAIAGSKLADVSVPWGKLDGTAQLLLGLGSAVGRNYDASGDSVASNAMTDLGDGAVAVTAAAGCQLEVAINFTALGLANPTVGRVYLVVDGATVIWSADVAVTTVAGVYSVTPNGVVPGRAGGALVWDATDASLVGGHSYKLQWGLTSPFAGRFDVSNRLLKVRAVS